MRDSGPEPMLSRYAVVSSTASTSRKSSVSASGTLSFRHVAPPSAVRRTVPLAPLAQTTLSPTALTPRRRAFTPLVCGVHVGPCAGACMVASAVAPASAATVNVFTAGILSQAGIRREEVGGRREAAGGGR